MQRRPEQTRQALVRAAAGLIASDRPTAGLVNICREAGVSRGALYHHFASIAELTAAVYEQARVRTEALADEAFAAAPEDAPARFCAALCAAMRDEELVRAGMQLRADGAVGPPRLRDDMLGLVHRRVEAGRPGGVELADLAVVVTAGLESLGRTDRAWWDPDASDRIWSMVRPLFAAAGQD